ncbi:hypothetical protein ES703_69807 [subsurface metagenome]
MKETAKETTVKVSRGPYDIVKKLSEEGDLSIRDVADALLEAGAVKLNTLAEVAQAVAENPRITAQEVNGQVYYCAECHHPIDPREKLESCPNCTKKFNWEAWERGESGEGGGFGALGWGLVGLAVLLAVGFQGNRNQG